MTGDYQNRMTALPKTRKSLQDPQPKQPPGRVNARARRELEVKTGMTNEAMDVSKPLPEAAIATDAQVRTARLMMT